MMGLANMAARLAYHRTRAHYPMFQDIAEATVEHIAPRGWIWGSMPASVEYYRIIDRITQGKAP